MSKRGSHYVEEYANGMLGTVVSAKHSFDQNKYVMEYTSSLEYVCIYAVGTQYPRWHFRRIDLLEEYQVMIHMDRSDIIAYKGL